MRRELFPTVVLGVRNAAGYIENYLRDMDRVLSAAFDFYEVIIVDDCSNDGTQAIIDAALQKYQNIVLYRLARSGGYHIATTVGLDNAIGDYVAILDPRYDQPELVVDMIDKLSDGVDIVYALPRERMENIGRYNSAVTWFLRLLAKFNRIDMPTAVSSARVISRAVLNYILKSTDRHRIIAVAPALSGYRYATVVYDRWNPGGVAALETARREALFKAVNLTFAMSIRPLRFVTLMSLGVSGVSLLYAIYALFYWAFGNDVAPGWTSLSLQVSGLFFLNSLVLAVMSEYLLQVLESNERRPLYDVARQAQSNVLTYDQSANVLSNEPAAKPEQPVAMPPPEAEKAPAGTSGETS